MRGLAVGFGVAVVVLATTGLGGVKAQEDEAADPHFYTAKVKPILDDHCGRCHGGMNHRGGLNIETRESLLKGGHDGPVLVPGDPDKSLLVRLIRHEGPPDNPMPMPPRDAKLSDADIALIAHWVKAGAIMPPPAAKP